MRPPRISIELMDWLRKTFPAQCIEPGQDLIAAHRYAAKVELAQKIIRMGGGDEDHDIPLHDED